LRKKKRERDKHTEKKATKRGAGESGQKKRERRHPEIKEGDEEPKPWKDDQVCMGAPREDGGEKKRGYPG